MRRREPRALSHAIAALADRLAPQTTLAEVQRVWPDAVGEVVAAQAEPTGERDGVLTVTCASAVWAQELDLMGPELTERHQRGARAPRRCARCAAPPPRRRAGRDDAVSLAALGLARGALGAREVAVAGLHGHGLLALEVAHRHGAAPHLRRACPRSGPARARSCRGPSPRCTCRWCGTCPCRCPTACPRTAFGPFFFFGAPPARAPFSGAHCERAI